MATSSFVRILAGITLVAAAVTSMPASATGDLPTKLSRRQATDHYRRLAPLLSGDGMACPRRGRPMSGLVTGGSTPQGGSLTIRIVFDNGGEVVVRRTWERTPATAHVEITCS